MSILFMDESDCPEVNIKASSFYTVAASVQCEACEARSRVAALAVPAAHQLFDEEVSSWDLAQAPALIFDLCLVPKSVLRHLRRVASGFRQSIFEPDAWRNHCTRCGMELDEQYLHCEPGVAFVPTTREEATRISLLLIEQPLSIWANGYAPAPEFFDDFTRP
jgi:hypothetical protein